MSTHAVYAGTFDPFTLGHEHILLQAIPLFDRITVAIGVNPAKKTMFSLDERLAMLLDATAHHSDRVKIASFEDRFLVDYAEEIGAQFIIRGIRNIADFEYEHGMSQINKRLNPNVTSVFFMADPMFAAVSSSMVKGLIGPKGWQDAIRPYLPYAVYQRCIAIDA